MSDWDEGFKRLDSIPDADTREAIEATATNLWNMYEAFVDRGFSEQQALALTMQMVAAR